MGSSDKRKYDRLEVESEVEVRDPDGNGSTGKVIDLSASGAQLELEKEIPNLQRGSELILKIGWEQKTVSWLRFETFLAIVKRVEGTQIGVEFIDGPDV